MLEKTVRSKPETWPQSPPPVILEVDDDHHHHHHNDHHEEPHQLGHYSGGRAERVEVTA